MPKAKTAPDGLETAANDTPETDSAVEMMDETATGQALVPGMEIAVIKPIIKLIKRHEETKATHRQLTEQLTGENDEALMLYEKYKEHFSVDEKGNAIYRSNGAELKIIIPKPTVKTDFEDE